METLEFRTLTAVGNGFLFGWVPKTGKAELWRLRPDGSLSSEPQASYVYGGSFRDNRVFAALDGALFSYDQKTSQAQVMELDLRAQGFADPLARTLLVQAWDPVLGGRNVLALDGNHILEWGLGTGRYGVVRYDAAPKPALTRFSALGTRPTLRRGYRWISLGGNRLLEWNPRLHTCQIWSYALDRLPAGDIFDPEPLVSEDCPELDYQHELLVLPERKLAIWDRDAGTVEVRAFDADGAEPLSGPSLNLTRDDRLRSVRPGQEPATNSAVRHLVVVFQHGRSFDAYFGDYCQGKSGSESCSNGPECCERMPEVVGGSNCVPLVSQRDEHVPNQSPTCVADKRLAWGNDRLVVSESCGDARDFSCAIADGRGPLAAYHELAHQGTLADNYFASTDESVLHNLGYFGSTQYTNAVDAHLITEHLAEAGIPFALYLSDLESTFGISPPFADDGSWAHLRALDELAYDIETQQLPPIAVVVPKADALESEAAGGASSLATAIGFTTGIARSVLSSERYADDSLVILTHLTSGGFYDHVKPPPPPPRSVDPTKKPYGSRVPFLALGPFVRKNHIFHQPLEHSSLTAFVEWNWFGATGQLHGRDAWVTNARELLDPTLAGMTQP